MSIHQLRSLISRHLRSLEGINDPVISWFVIQVALRYSREQDARILTAWHGMLKAARLFAKRAR